MEALLPNAFGQSSYMFCLEARENYIDCTHLLSVVPDQLTDVRSLVLCPVQLLETVPRPPWRWRRLPLPPPYTCRADTSAASFSYQWFSAWFTAALAALVSS